MTPFGVKKAPSVKFGPHPNKILVFQDPTVIPKTEKKKKTRLVLDCVIKVANLGSLLDHNE